ncbi:hypothetical protein [Mitsuaria sp. 7]|uniref:hypothetical protein n=1 Tax=Mitsuaria sp. 7 TaxID=1658665 RepID=UPI0007DD908D|nr:hypothetical protein [Mitsuaria sp. 7]ANH67402.1 hypothetical protein ABE85_07150 [Mitsuaria sp. 7]
MTSDVKMPLEDLLLCLDDLEYLVPSLAQIGSASLGHEERALELQRFAIEGNVFRRLATMRNRLTLVLEAQLSKAEVERFDARMEKIETWKVRSTQ